MPTKFPTKSEFALFRKVERYLYKSLGRGGGDGETIARDAAALIRIVSNHLKKDHEEFMRNKP